MDEPPRNLPSATDGSPMKPSWQPPTFLTRTLSGIENIQAEWTITSPITQRLREQAAAWFRTHELLIRPASSQGIERWLVQLAIQCAGSSMSSEEAKIRAIAYVSTLADEPGYWFTGGTLKAAAKHFKWFPSVAELVEFFGGECRERSQQVRCAREIINGRPEQPREVYQMEPLGVRLQAIADSYARHYGADHPKTIAAKARLEPRHD